MVESVGGGADMPWEGEGAMWAIHFMGKICKPREREIGG